ncbi:MAG: 2-C-methyl-D-erythritol 2,4-cyclodiphosphate synthase [Negativicutes bacterium]|nr:2-C-methyl-D-erythritol 2,4-cyclodiphosphate synthase [Negativicutes bacterium]
MLRTGMGYDAHKLSRSRKLILGGVEVEYEMGLLGYSDADVVVHAAMDAILGAAGLGDIGRHFPDTDPRYKGISSLNLLERVRELLHGKGYVLNNLDVVIVAQRPKLRPYIGDIEQNLARVLWVSPENVNVKATTTEGMGFTGRQEGIAAYATCTIIPSSWQQGG